MGYIGKDPADSYISFVKQDFSVSATTSYTLDNAVTNQNEIALFINHVRQEPTTAYTASGTSLTLTSATASGDDMYCVYLGIAKQTVNPPDGSVGTTQLAADAVTEAKIADTAIENEHLNVNVITGQTAETSIATDDTILIHDTSASALRKMTRANFVSGVGGNNAPLFFAYKSGTQNPSDATTTKVEYDGETYDPSGVYDNSSNYRFTPGVAGYYYIFAGVGISAFGVSLMAEGEINIYKNGSNVIKARHNASNNYQYWIQPTVQGIVQLDADDYVEIYAKGDVTTSTPIYFYQSSYSWFGGYKLID